MPNEVRNKVDRFIFPVRRLIFQREGDFQSMECHYRLYRNQSLADIDESLTAFIVRFVTYPLFIRSKRVLSERWKSIFVTIRDRRKQSSHAVG